jgi:hypothetical protein
MTSFFKKKAIFFKNLKKWLLPLPLKQCFSVSKAQFGVTLLQQTQMEVF